MPAPIMNNDCLCPKRRQELHIETEYILFNIIMPFVRISLPKSLSIETKHAVYHAVHESLVTEFGIPQDDYFHVIEELEEHQLLFPNNYLGIEHAKDIVYVHITAGAGRTTDDKRRLYSQMANRITTATSIRIEDVIIVLVENNGKEDWSFGRGEIQVPPHLAGL